MRKGDGIYYNICEGGIVYGCFKGDLVLLFGRSYSAFAVLLLLSYRAMLYVQKLIP